eukprot:scaffold6708_cov134-Cylindrotheca_fusiformis.AAC.32
MGINLVLFLFALLATLPLPPGWMGIWKRGSQTTPTARKFDTVACPRHVVCAPHPEVDVQTPATRSTRVTVVPAGGMGSRHYRNARPMMIS